MIRNSVAILVCFLWIAETSGVSRVGTASIGSDKSGFSVKVPYPFIEFFQLRDEGVRMKSALPSNQIDADGNLIPNVMEAADFDKVYNELAFPGQLEAISWFGQNQWTDIQTVGECISTALKENGSSITGVALWGPRHGVVFRGFNTKGVQEAMTKMLSSIQLKEGACQW